MATRELQEIRLDVEESVESAPAAGEHDSAAAESQFQEISVQHSENGKSTSAGIPNARDHRVQAGEQEKEQSSIVTHEGPDDPHETVQTRRRVTLGSFRSRWSDMINTIMGTMEVSTAEADGTDGDSEKPPPLTGLHQAARDDLSKMVDMWIKYVGEDGKTKLNEKDEDGMAPVHYAAKFNRLKALKKLYNSGVDFTLATSEEQYTPLHFAASYIPRYKIQQDGSGNQAVQKSYLSSSKETMEFLVNAVQLEVNAKGKNNVTPLHLACQRGNLEAAMILLSQSGLIESNVQDTHGDTPLHQACRYGHEKIVEVLLKDKNLFKSLHSLRNRENQTPLHLACQEGHTMIVRKLLEKCPSEKDGRKMLLEVHDNEGNTALHLAIESLKVVKNQEPEIVKVLLEYGADPSEVKIAKQKSKKGRHGHTTEIGDRATPLHLAARYGLVKVIVLLLDHDEVSINALTRSSQTPLHFAAIHNQVSAAEVLIARGANTEWKDVNSCTPFLVAAANGAAGVVAKLEEIEEVPIQVDKLDKNRKSAVFLAAEGAHFPLLKHLLGTRNRRDVHSMTMSVTSSLQSALESPLIQVSRKLCSTPDVDLNTPLHIAAKLGHVDIVEELLKDELIKGGYVKLDARNSMNKTPAHLAAEYGHVKILELILRTKRLVFDEDDDGNTPLHLAAHQGWKHAVKLLLDRKANIDARNADLATPLSLAAGSGHEHVVKLLLQSKAEVNIQDRSQATPLHYAIKKGHIGVVKVLLLNGASCSQKDKDWYNALDLAIESGHEDVARIIIQSDQWEDALRNTTEYGTPFRKLIVRMPDVAREVLNRCTVYEELDGESDTKYNYRYLEDFYTPHIRKHSDKIMRCLKPFTWWIHRNFPTHGYHNTWGPKGFSRSDHPLTFMTESKDSRLLSHPLVISLLMFKLRNYVGACYLSLFLVHCVLLLCLTVFALEVFNPNEVICQLVDEGKFNTLNTGENQSEICNDNFTIQALRDSCGDGNRYNVIYTFGIGVLFAALVRIVILLFKFANYCRHLKTLWSFITDFQNWVEVPMLVFSVIFVSVFGRSCPCPMKWQWEIGTVAVLLVWFDFITFIRYLQLFDIGIYVLMFGHMIKTFIRAAFISFLLLIAFSLAFYMAFHVPELQHSPFFTPSQTILTVLTFGLGGADYNGLFALSPAYEEGPDKPGPPFVTVSIILWILFIVGILILLINMLIGLAVEDIKGIKRAAEVQRLKLLVDLTLSVESILPYRHLFIIPEGTAMTKKKGLNLWRRINDFLWEGKIEQDTPEKIAEALTNQSEPSVEQIHAHTNSLMKEQAAMRETMKAMNDRNRRMEAALVDILSVLRAQFGTSPSAELEL